MTNAPPGNNIAEPRMMVDPKRGDDPKATVPWFIVLRIKHSHKNYQKLLNCSLAPG